MTGGRTILITGASSGIGKALAREVARRFPGARLALTARRSEALRAIATELQATGCRVAVIPDDLADSDAPARIMAAVVAQFGGLDVLVNNAGLGLPEPFAEADPKEMARQVQVNFTAAIVLTRLALPHLIPARGTVINVGSSITCVANPIFGVYGATKAAMAYWNDALRREMRPKGVSVCLVEPGPVATEFFQAVASRFPGHESQGGSASTADLASAEKFRQFAAIDPPPAWTSATPEDVAHRVARLIDRPKRRLSVLRRVVWPFRAIGAVVGAFPILGDVVVGRMVARMDRARGEAHGE